jgi:hypothetical protein
MNTIILLTFILRTANGIVPEDLAIVKDMETCRIIAKALNTTEPIASDDNAAVICREVEPTKTTS